LYGRFTQAQKAIVTDLLLSLSVRVPLVERHRPAVPLKGRRLRFGHAKNAQVVLASQLSDEGCSLMRKSLMLSQLPSLAARARAAKVGGVALVLTAEDVAVEGFCVTCLFRLTALQQLRFSS
ncbi:hypothetical protein EJB05_05490, partial [Eragrostis curvula]